MELNTGWSTKHSLANRKQWKFHRVHSQNELNESTKLKKIICISANILLNNTSVNKEN